jgi:creatinine amidohydrolase
MTELAALAWTEVQPRLRRLLVVPVGSTEQHGPHLPLSTDTDIAVALAHALAREDVGALVAPAVAYGSSGEHGGFAGTLSIGQEATEELLVELCRSASATFERILLLSTHGGNAEPVGRAVQCLRDEGRDVRVWASRWPGDAHAGRTETSVMLAIAPERVSLEHAVTGNVDDVARLLPRLREAGVRSISPNGVLGEPAGASAEEGRELLRTATDELVAMIASWDEATREERCP